MADLEAVTRVPVPGAEPTNPVVVSQPGASLKGPPAPPAPPGMYRWRYPLPEGRAVRLGSDPAHSEWVVPEDNEISRWHAILEWGGEALTVSERPQSPEYPKPPTNPIWHVSRGRPEAMKRFEVRPGESFMIGKTVFTVHGAGAPEPVEALETGPVARHLELSRDDLQRSAFADPGELLRALGRLPEYLGRVANESALFKQMLKVVMTALPGADVAAIVRVLPDGPEGDPRVTVVEQNTRHPDGTFAPSRRLARRAVREERRSCLYVWSSGPIEYTYVAGADPHPGGFPWAVCAPFQGDSPLALYMGGRTPTPDAPRLTEYQKFAEILVGLIASTHRVLQLNRQLAVAGQAWPRNLRQHLLDDPGQFEELLQVPQEREVTVLFCDLRGYSARAEQRGGDLAGAWSEVRQALDIMSSAVTENGGIVAGFRGDAVLGFWGWPDAQTGRTPDDIARDQVPRAAKAALRIYEKLSGPMMKRLCGLGLTHGRALAGRLGAHDLAVVDLYGPVVNLAFRLEEMTKAYKVGIVVSDVVAAALRAADPHGRGGRLRPLGLVRPRGMARPLEVSELAPGHPLHGFDSWVLSSTYAANLPVWTRAVELFRAGAWAGAVDQFGAEFDGDPAAECFLRYVRRHGGAPPKGWDGAFTPRPEDPKE